MKKKWQQLASDVDGDTEEEERKRAEAEEDGLAGVAEKRKRKKTGLDMVKGMLDGGVGIAKGGASMVKDGATAGMDIVKDGAGKVNKVLALDEKREWLEKRLQKEARKQRRLNAASGREQQHNYDESNCKGSTFWMSLSDFCKYFYICTLSYNQLGFTQSFCQDQVFSFKWGAMTFELPHTEKNCFLSLF